jgi:hypothetical protein
MAVLRNWTKRIMAQRLEVVSRVQNLEPPYKGFTTFLNKHGLIEDVSVAYFYTPDGTLVATHDWVRGWCTPKHGMLRTDGPYDDYDDNESIPEYTFSDRPITDLLILLLLQYWDEHERAPLFISDEDIAFSKSHPHEDKWQGEWEYGVVCNRVDGGYYIRLSALEQK